MQYACLTPCPVDFLACICRRAPTVTTHLQQTPVIGQTAYLIIGNTWSTVAAKALKMHRITVPPWSGLINSRRQSMITTVFLFFVINCAALLNHVQRSSTLKPALIACSLILLCWTHTVWLALFLSRGLSERITMLMSVRLLVMETLASSNMAGMPLIKLIGKPTGSGCLACSITSAHSFTLLHFIFSCSFHSSSKSPQLFSKSWAKPRYTSRTLTLVLRNLLFSIMTPWLFPRLRSIVCTWVCVCHIIHYLLAFSSHSLWARI